MPIYEDENETKEKIYLGKKHIACFMDISTYGYRKSETPPNGKTTWKLLSNCLAISRKPKQKENSKKRHELNKELENEQGRKWYRGNKENKKLQTRNWNKHHREERLAMSKKHYQKNKTKILKRLTKQRIERKKNWERIQKEKQL